MALHRISLSSLRRSAVASFDASFSSSTPVLPSTLLSGARLWQQRRHAKVLDMRFLQLTRPQTQVAEKYKDMLEQKAKSEGLGSVDELKEAYKDKIKEYKKESLAPPPEPPFATTATGTTASTTAPPPLSAKKPPFKPPAIPKTSAIKTLDAFIDVDKILQHDAKEIEYLWRARHVNSPSSLCAVIPRPTYEHMESLAKQHPMFILPLPRKEQGVEFHFLQWKFSSPKTVDVIFTSLVEYKLKGEFASPHTTVTHHLDILPEKGIVLLQGTVMENRGVSADEAQWLLMALQKFYATPTSTTAATVEDVNRRRELLRLFSEGKSEFDIGRLIHEVETI